jgi:hypothetical protein
MLGLPSVLPLGDASVVTPLSSSPISAQNAPCRWAFYRDMMFSLANDQQQIISKVVDVETVGEEVAAELEKVGDYNEVLRKPVDRHR